MAPPNHTGNHVERDLEALRSPAPASILPKVLVATGLEHGYITRETPLGTVFIAFSPDGVTACVPAGSAAAFRREYARRYGRPATAVAAAPRRIEVGVDRALETGRLGSLPLDLSDLSEFQIAVLRKAAEIGPGEVRPYGWIAREIGRPGAVRAVGTALATNPIPVLIPCHRVVRSDGTLGRYAFGTEGKRAILEAEGLDTVALETEAGTGVRYYGSDTTNIYCYPSCRHARRVTAAHRITFRSAGEAATLGYRPCLVCRPEPAAA
jgi:O-6-methylguanine DNA methyltransferase